MSHRHYIQNRTFAEEQWLYQTKLDAAPRITDHIPNELGPADRLYCKPTPRASSSGNLQIASD
jgi:hypothetical protein